MNQTVHVHDRPPVQHLGVFRSSKTYDFNEGLSCCFRQWRADHSHCRLIHGYALAFKFVFSCHELDARNWCIDFGSLKPVRTWLHEMFDHTMVVAADDPHLPRFEELARQNLVDLRIMPAVGCEATARYVHENVTTMIRAQTGGRVWVESVEVREHGSNSATYSTI